MNVFKLGEPDTLSLLSNFNGELRFNIGEPKIAVLSKYFEVNSIVIYDGCKETPVLFCPLFIKGNSVVIPMLSQYTGIYIKDNEKSSYTSQLSKQHRYLSLFLEQLSGFRSIEFTFHYDLQNILPLIWEGFDVKPRITYILERDDTDLLWGKLKSSVRGKIKKARKNLTTIENISAEDFYEVNSKTFQRQGIKTPYTKKYLTEFFSSFSDYKCGKSFAAVDKAGQVVSVAYVTWDDRSAYLHLAGDDPEYRHLGGGILVIWEAILFVFTKLDVDVFDFEGSMIKGVEEVRRSFGAKQKIYYSVQKFNSKRERIKYHLLQELKSSGIGSIVRTFKGYIR
ncbi:GNAT family N-acetyltransferase [Shewanella rhizosphaerae]|uniref:GNAT family N-acetyltransferase n=1 Tax=Shewanella rhizosphaerae TaxID=2864207 RepID=UPI001C65578D|nr:GNAT family N-acetyltransferase [Shewanella rhizosphaerae]QYK14257.1 GNAT family N-acetyltransferase [Shewanella rhizosphaerae]